MKVIAMVVASFWLAGAAMAQTAGASAGATCKANADKSLHGAALSSTLKKCCREAAVSQKLHGAAESGFRKSCEQAALGT
ncbi:MAG: hypothetical protein WBF58_14020 [Xanthobacteraceae bacterium]